MAIGTRPCSDVITLYLKAQIPDGPGQDREFQCWLSVEQANALIEELADAVGRVSDDEEWN